MSDVSSNKQFIPAHGGQLFAAAQYFSRPLEQWLDLSTGINPSSWMTQPKAQKILHNINLAQHLPQPYSHQDNPAINAALQYYAGKTISKNSVWQTDNVLPCAGSMQIIQWLPYLYLEQANRFSKDIRACQINVYMRAGSFSGHQNSWQQAGFRVKFLPEVNGQLDLDKTSELINNKSIDILVLINPDNPTAQQQNNEMLYLWWQALQANNAWLVVDEAFGDTLEISFYQYIEKLKVDDLAGLFILKSMGKFFGLAGIRAGFIFAQSDNIKTLEDKIGAWPISHQCQAIMPKALLDFDWIDQQKEILALNKNRLLTILQASLVLKEIAFENINIVSTELFATVYTDQAYDIFHCLAQQGILTRYFQPISDNNKIKRSAAVRLGLAQNEDDWQRLKQALDNVSKIRKTV